MKQAPGLLYRGYSLRDDRDISRQCGNMYARIKPSYSGLVARYTAAIRWNFRAYSLGSKLSHNDVMRLVLLPRWHRASQMCVNINAPTCQAAIKNLVFQFMNRLEKSENKIIKCLVRI